MPNSNASFRNSKPLISKSISKSDRSRNKEGLSADILICLRATLYEIKALRRDISVSLEQKKSLSPKMLALADRVYAKISDVPAKKLFSSAAALGTTD